MSDAQKSASLTNSVSTDQWQASWCGLPYLEGTAAGESSVRRFLHEHAAALCSASQHLKGIYFLSLLDRRSNIRFAFIDPNGLFHAFYSSRRMGPSFLQVAREEQLGPDDMCPYALVEFLHNGYISFGETFFPAIRRMDPEHVFRLRPQGTIELLPRTLRSLDVVPEHSFEQCLANFSSSVASERLSLDLTGGIDSRLLAVMLRYLGLTFECALSGMHGNTDIPLAQQVAAALGCDFHVTYHTVGDLEVILPQLFTACDGVFDILKAHRLFKLHRDRRDRGVTLSLSGAGGELFKDFWWLQDFPLYARRHANLAKLYDLRIGSVPPSHSYLAGAYRDCSERYREMYLAKLSGLVVAGNTQTYDRIYYEVKMRDYAGRFLTTHTGLMPSYAPYLDREMVAVGYTLPRLTRAFNIFHRTMISRYNPAIAKLTTSEGGMSVSIAGKDILTDIPRYCMDKFGRLARKLGLRVAAPATSHDDPNNPELWTRGRDLMRRRKALENLKDYGLISGAVRESELRPEYIGTVLSLEMLLEYLAQSRSSPLIVEEEHPSPVC